MDYAELLIRHDGLTQLLSSGTNLAVVSPSSAGVLMGMVANKKELLRVETALAELEIAHGIDATERWTPADEEYGVGLGLLKGLKINK